MKKKKVFKVLGYFDSFVFYGKKDKRVKNIPPEDQIKIISENYDPLSDEWDYWDYSDYYGPISEKYKVSHIEANGKEKISLQDIENALSQVNKEIERQGVDRSSVYFDTYSKTFECKREETDEEFAFRQQVSQARKDKKKKEKQIKKSIEKKIFDSGDFTQEEIKYLKENAYNIL